jgi:hypothetical protein
MSSKRITCKATTLRGKHCSRIAVEDHLCRQHYKQIHGHVPNAPKINAFSKAEVMAPTKGCPPGMVKRKGYVRRAFVRASGSKVKGSKVATVCIPDRGSKGRAWKLKNKTLGIGKLKKGDLTKFGYSAKSPERSRHSAIKKAVKKTGAVTIERKLNALAVYTKNTNPKLSKEFKQDSLYAATLKK